MNTDFPAVFPGANQAQFSIERAKQKNEDDPDLFSTERDR